MLTICIRTFNEGFICGRTLWIPYNWEQM